jgi:DNA-binding MarR family transcriptional regulator
LGDLREVLQVGIDGALQGVRIALARRPPERVTAGRQRGEGRAVIERFVAGASTFPIAGAERGSRKVIIKTTFNGYALWRTDHTKLGHGFGWGIESALAHDTAARLPIGCRCLVRAGALWDDSTIVRTPEASRPASGTRSANPDRNGTRRPALDGAGAPAARGANRSQPATAREIWELLLEMSRTHLKDHLAVTVSELELSLPQAHALQLLDPGSPVPMRDLAARLRCDASNITGIVDRLEARGLVERRAAPGDRRVKALVVTAKGVELRAVLVERLHRVPAAVAELSDAEQRTLLELLRRVASARDGGDDAIL